MKYLFRFGAYSLLLIAITVFSSYTSTIAQVNIITDEDQFIADNPGLAFQDFQAANVPMGIFVLCTVPVNSNSDDDCFSPGDILPGIEFASIPPNVGGFPGLCVTGEDLGGLNNNPPNMLLACFPDGIEEVSFTSGNNTAVGLRFGCVTDEEGTTGCVENIKLNVFGPGDAELIDLNIVVTDDFDNFIGIESVQPITKITLMFSPVTPEDRFKGIANVRFGSPEPPSPEPPSTTAIPTLSEWGLVAMAGILGIVGFMVIRRRKVNA